MKTLLSISVSLRLSTSIACLILLSSCYTYKPCLNKGQTSPADLREKIIPGHKYEVLLTNGQQFDVKVDSVMEDKLIGTVGESKINYRQKDYLIFLDQIVAVKEQKRSVGLTVLAFGVPIVFLAILVTNMNWNFGGGISLL
jgi:hypothetical protein